jgi:hypothetical protein
MSVAPFIHAPGALRGLPPSPSYGLGAGEPVDRYQAFCFVKTPAA